MADKIVYTKLVSPKGVAVYPHLNKADDKFGDPVFKVTLRVPEEDAAPLVAKIEEMLTAIKKGDTTAMREADAKRLPAAIKAKKLKAADPAFVTETDEDGNETGNVLLKFKASGQFKDKDGNIVKRKIKFIDAAKQPIENPPLVWGGSTLRVRAMLMPWVNAKSEYGVKLGIDLVQIIELVTSDGAAVNTDGFDEEEGYGATAYG
jgi:hypothetical protein